MRPAGWNRSFLELKSMWLTPPPRIDPMMPTTMVQKSVMCTCITDFEMTPAKSPIRMYQSR